MHRTGNLIVISAPSGSGKTTIVQGILAQLPEVEFSVSFTTRAKREGEVDGRDYVFIERPTFHNMVEEGEFVEWAEFLGNLYGTSRAFVESRVAAGVDVLLDIDVQGARQIKALHPQAILIFIMPPSFALLAQRLRKRGLDTEETVRLRLDRAREETRLFDHYDFVIINDEAAAAVADACSVIRSGRCRVANNLNRIKEIIRTFGDNHHV